MDLQVPFALKDQDISDDWQCSDNVWDAAHKSCAVPQALSNEAIDTIIANQVRIRPQGDETVNELRIRAKGMSGCIHRRCRHS